MRLGREIKPIERLFDNSVTDCDVEQTGIRMVVSCRDKQTGIDIWKGINMVIYADISWADLDVGANNFEI